MRRLSLCSIVILALVILAPPPQSRAQDDQPDVVIMQTIAEGQDNGLRLRVFFAVRGKDHRPIAPDKIESAQIQLSSDVDPITAAIENPTTAIKIALLLDESGSMRPYINQVRSAAKDAIDKAPDQAQFALFRFSDLPSEGELAPDLGFTPKSESDTIKNFIDQQYNPQNQAPTCLYNAALKAVRYLAANVAKDERRAIILFTDGKDERANGQPCSDRKLDDVIREAAPETSTFTPIYTVGLCTAADCGNIDGSVLTRMASQTNAISRAGTLENLTGLFYDVMDDLKAQKLAQATIAPCEEKQATLIVSVTSFREPIRGIVNFPSDTCYAPPASAKVSEPQPNQGKNTYIFPVTIENPSPLDLQGVEIQVIDPNNTLVYTNTLQQPEYQVPARGRKELSIEVPARGMIATGEYTIKVLALTKEGRPFVNKKVIKGMDSDVLGAIVFKHVLSGNVQIAIESVGEPDYNRMILPVRLQISNKEILGPYLNFLKYEGGIFEGNSEILPFGPKEIDLTNANPSFSIEVPVPDSVRAIQATTRYEIAVTLLAPQDPRFGSTPQRYEASRYQFELKPLPPRSPWEGVIALILSPFALGGLLLLVLVIAGAIAYPRLRSRRRAIPRPFNSATVVNPEMPRPAAIGGGATVMHTPDKPRKRVWIKVVQTVNPAQQLLDQKVALPCVIGRELADFVITGDVKLSRAHAKLSIENGVFTLTDLNSANGTFLGDTRLDKGGSVPFSGRTRVRLGPNTIIELEPQG